MSTGSQKKSRSQLVAGLDPVPKLSTRVRQAVGRGDVILRCALCLFAAIIVAVATRAWAPPFAFREGYTPIRSVVARVDFTLPNPQEEEAARIQARRQARQAYKNDPQPLLELRARLLTEVAKLIEATDFDASAQEIWSRFEERPSAREGEKDEQDLKRRQESWQRDFESFRTGLSGENRLKFDQAVERAFVEPEKHGLLEKPAEFASDELRGNQAEILVFPKGDWDARKPIEIKEVQITYVKPRLEEQLRRELQTLEAQVEVEARSQLRQTFLLDSEPLVQLRNELLEKVQALAAATEFDEDTTKLWREFLARETEETPLPDAEEQKNQFEKFREAMVDADQMKQFEEAIAAVFGPIEKRGLLIDLKSQEEAPEANAKEVIVVSSDKEEETKQIVPVEEVRLDDVKPALREQLEKQLKSLEISGRIYTWLEQNLPRATTLTYTTSGDDTTRIVPARLADRAYHWLETQLPTTLKYDEERSKEVREAAAAAVSPDEHATQFKVGDTLAHAGVAIEPESMKRLRAEYEKLMQQLPASSMLNRMLAVLGMYLALYTLCGLFIFFRYPNLLSDTRKLLGLLTLSLCTVMMCYFAASWKAEMVPLLLFGMTVAISYRQELALLLSAAVALIVVLSVGFGLIEFVILTAATATAVLMLRRVRSRVKLVYVGICCGLVAMLTTIGVNLVDSQPLNWFLLRDAGLNGLWGVAAGFAMTGLLPFIENIFDVLTDISLLELGDVAHPLLQELVRRAPGTYNHSINVASLAEAAADAIGARGLLVRVGAYFHDIGKMLKPQYFVENQGKGDNRHESLVPAMSTLVIIAHVKDGAELAREHHLPQPIIDFIQQHHGTTLVEYFYRRASEDSRKDPDGGDVDENTFRYPGPKPQNKETGILMLADAVESASRVLVEPTPSRIESLVEELAMKRLLDGQLDECGLTLKEVRTVQDSLIKSLTAVYHGRVKYPDQKTA